MSGANLTIRMKPGQSILSALANLREGDVLVIPTGVYPVGESG